MRILYINVNYKYSSTGKIVYDLYTQARADGHEAAVCYGRGPLLKDPDVYKFGLDWETNFHALMTRVTGLTGCWSYFSTRRLLRFIDSYKPDIIHLHEMYAYFVNQQPLFDYLAEQKIPVVYTFHCEDAYTGKCGHALDCQHWMTSCGNCPQVRIYPKSLFLDFTKLMHSRKKARWEKLRNAVITTPSQWLADRVARSFLKDRSIRVIHNGIDVENLFHPHRTEDLRAELGLQDEKIVLAVAPWLMSPSKGGRWVVQLAQMMQDENIKFVLVGVEDLSEKFPDNVIAVGKVTDQQKLATFYSLADCFVICSQKETFSLTCAESLCCGTPVAGFCAGAPETVFMAPEALFAPYGDLECLKKYVQIQLHSGFEREKLAQKMHLQFSGDSMYHRFMALYQEMTGEV